MVKEDLDFEYVSAEESEEEFVEEKPKPKPKKRKRKRKAKKKKVVKKKPKRKPKKKKKVVKKKPKRKPKRKKKRKAPKKRMPPKGLWEDDPETSSGEEYDVPDRDMLERKATDDIAYEESDEEEKITGRKRKRDIGNEDFVPKSKKRKY